MPTATYEQLLVATLPTRIENDEQYDMIRSRFGEMLGKRRRTAAEDKLMDLLGVLIEDYDRRNALPPDDVTADERLRFLLEHSGRINPKKIEEIQSLTGSPILRRICI